MNSQPPNLYHAFKVWLMLLAPFITCPGKAQRSIANKSGHETSYFIDLNVNSSSVHQLPDNVWSVKYFDALNTRDFLPVTIYDWTRQEVGYYKLSKAYGLNYYNIEMEYLKPEQTYFAEAIDEAGVIHRTAFSIMEQSTSDKPRAEIVVNPINLSCEVSGDNVMEFYVVLSEGRSPYQVRWFILDETMSDFLYQPRFEKIEGAGKGMAVMVNADPAYHVLAQIEDACGNQVNKVISVDCKEEEKVYHSVFIEPLPRTIKKAVKQ